MLISSNQRLAWRKEKAIIDLVGAFIKSLPSE